MNNTGTKSGFLRIIEPVSDVLVVSSVDATLPGTSSFTAADALTANDDTSIVPVNTKPVILFKVFIKVTS